MNLILRLALVLVVIWAAIVAMRWWVRRMNGGAGSGGGHLQIVETRSLGPNRSLQLVKIGNRAVLVGVTAEQISSVLEIDDPAEVERLARPAVVKDSPTSFGDAVSRLGSLTSWRPVIERKRATPATASTAAPRQAARPTAGRAPARARSLTPTPASRSRWMTLARRVVGLEDPPRRASAAGAARSGRSTAAAGAAPQAVPTPGARRASRAPRSLPAASAAAAELPASRAVRARSGYQQSQIAEAQRAISAVRSGMTR